MLYTLRWVLFPKDYYLIIINIPEQAGIEEPASLPKNWNSFPHSDSTRKIGDSFIAKNKNLILKVPSAVVPGDYNYLLNPLHKDFSLVNVISTEPFLFDHRLFKK